MPRCFRGRRHQQEAGPRLRGPWHLQCGRGDVWEPHLLLKVSLCTGRVLQTRGRGHPDVAHLVIFGTVISARRARERPSSRAGGGLAFPKPGARCWRCAAPRAQLLTRVCARLVPTSPPPLRDSERGLPGESAETSSQLSRAVACSPRDGVVASGRRPRRCLPGGRVGASSAERPVTEPPGQRAVCRALPRRPVWKAASPSRWPGRGAVSSPPPYRWGTWVTSGPVHTASQRWGWSTRRRRAPAGPAGGPPAAVT